MDVESMHSGFSARSYRSDRSSRHRGMQPHQPPPGKDNKMPPPIIQSIPSNMQQPYLVGQPPSGYLNHPLEPNPHPNTMGVATTGGGPIVWPRGLPYSTTSIPYQQRPPPGYMVTAGVGGPLPMPSTQQPMMTMQTNTSICTTSMAGNVGPTPYQQMMPANTGPPLLPSQYLHQQQPGPMPLVSRSPRRNHGDKIRVHIMPQDDNFLETGTAFTGATSDTQFTGDEHPATIEDPLNVNKSNMDCVRTTGQAVAACLCVLSSLSPVIMVVLPKLSFLKWSTNPCGPSCEGQLISLAIKLVLLLLASLCIFARKARSSTPRTELFRCFLLCLLLFLTLAFWIFYGIRFLRPRSVDYQSLLNLSTSLLDCLLFLHYASVVALELRSLGCRWAVKLVRSSDGKVLLYRVGDMSVQQTAAYMLQCYITDFQTYNPHLESTNQRRSRSSTTGHSSVVSAGSVLAARINGAGKSGSAKYKFYDVDGPITTEQQGVGAGSVSGSRRHRSPRARRGGTDRYYDQLDLEKRLGKRKMRLITASEEAFAHVKRLDDSRATTGVAQSMPPYETAQSVFPTLVKPLQKLLRATHQQHRFTTDSILAHLSTCLAYGLSPAVFVEPFLSTGRVIEDNLTPPNASAQWNLRANCPLARGIQDGVVFQLTNLGQDVNLLCSVTRLPFFSLVEESFDPRDVRFTLKLNSDASV